MKKVKMILYGEPGTGKSVFAGNAPRPFFITTDGNYEWLEGLVPDFNINNHLQISSWFEATQIFSKLNSPIFDNYDTIVIDLVEDLYDWCEKELCDKGSVQHISELGDYGKGYDLLRKPFIATMKKVIAIDKNVILLSHESQKDVKNKRGVSTTIYTPSSIMSTTKVWDKLTGEVRFCLRCYKDYREDDNGHTVIERKLHLITQPDEYGTYRIDNPNTPETIPLDWNIFADTVGLNVNENNQVYTPILDLNKNAPVARTATIAKPKPVVQTTPTVATKPVVQSTPKVVETQQTKAVVETPKVVTDTPKVATETQSVVETPKVVEETKPVAQATSPSEITNEMIEDFVKQGLSVIDIQNKLNVKLTTSQKMLYVKLKNQK